MSHNVDVAIIGAGAAGIAAARMLAGRPLTCLVLEAGDRIGGRAFTRIEGGLPVDMGCGWLHSADRNPLARIGEEIGFTIDRTPPPWGEQACNQGMSVAEQAAFHAAYDDWGKRVLAAAKEPDRSAAELLDPESRWNPLIDALSAYVNGAETRSLSVHDYAAYVGADSGVNWRVGQGYGSLIAHLGSDLPAALGTAVKAIDHNNAEVRLSTSGGEVTARAVIVTASTAVLAAEAIQFDPPIPDKLEAAHGLPLGLADKLILKFDEPEMFPADSHLFGRTDTRETGSYHLRPFGRPLIEVYFGGLHAEMLERGGPKELAGFAIDELASLIGSAIRAKLDPVTASAWRSEPWIRGAYSHALPAHRDARAKLAEPVAGRLFFAGEACSSNDFSTAHGAWQSGIDAAERVLEALRLTQSTTS